MWWKLYKSQMLKERHTEDLAVLRASIGLKYSLCPDGGARGSVTGSLKSNCWPTWALARSKLCNLPIRHCFCWITLKFWAASGTDLTEESSYKTQNQRGPSSEEHVNLWKVPSFFLQPLATLKFFSVDDISQLSWRQVWTNMISSYLLSVGLAFALISEEPHSQDRDDTSIHIQCNVCLYNVITETQKA